MNKRIVRLEEALKIVNEYLGEEAPLSTKHDPSSTPRDYCLECYEQIGFFSDDAHREDCPWWKIKQVVLNALTQPE